MRKLFVLLLILPTLASSQIRTGFTKYIIDTLPANLNIKASVIRDHIYNNIPENYKKGIYEKMSIVFAGESAFEISEYLRSGSIYCDNVELENYLNEILQKVAPPEMKNDSFIRVYLIRNGHFNAFMTPSGQMFVNIGLFTDINDEATIAAVFAHELAHYYFNHALQYYISDRTGKFDLGFLVGKVKDFSNNYNIDQEISADSMAIRLLDKSGYNLTGIMTAFDITSVYEKNIVCRMDKKWEIKENDHPRAGIRNSNLAYYYKKHYDDSESYFLVSEEKFKKFKEDIKPEILKALLDNYDYYACIEIAFKYHLYSPENIVYIKYLMEGIRRNCYIDNDLWKKPFIIDRYFDSIPSVSTLIPGKSEMKGNLFSKMNLDVLSMREEDTNRINAKFYWNGPLRYTTYEEAFDFYFKLSRSMADHECYLSNALSYTTDKNTRNMLLEKYLSFPDIKNRGYAEKLLQDSITLKLGNKKLYVLNRIYTTIRLGKEDVPIQSYGSDTTNDISCILDSAGIAAQNNTVLYLPKLSHENFIEYKMLGDIQTLSFLPLVSKGERVELYMLDPSILDIYEKYDVNEICFINCFYFENRKAEKTFDAFKNVMDSNIKDIFSQSGATRFINITISNVRIMKDRLSRNTFIGYMNKSDSGKTGYQQIASEINIQLEEAGKRGLMMEGLLNGK